MYYSIVFTYFFYRFLVRCHKASRLCGWLAFCCAHTFRTALHISYANSGSGGGPHALGIAALALCNNNPTPYSLTLRRVSLFLLIELSSAVDQSLYTAEYPWVLVNGAVYIDRKRNGRKNKDFFKHKQQSLLLYSFLLVNFFFSKSSIGTQMIQYLSGMGGNGSGRSSTAGSLLPTTPCGSSHFFVENQRAHTP